MTEVVKHIDTFFRAGVIVILYNAETKKILLGKRHANTKLVGGTWQFPQGGIEPGSTPIETAIIEVEEETGIIISKK